MVFAPHEINKAVLMYLITNPKYLLVIAVLITKFILAKIGIQTVKFNNITKRSR